MTAPALIKQSDLTSAAKVANKQGCCIEIKAGNFTYRIIPNAPDGKPQIGHNDEAPEPVL